jgi:large subunit ribosomal protein L6e
MAREDGAHAGCDPWKKRKKSMERGIGNHGVLGDGIGPSANLYQQARKSVRPAKPRASLKPGTVVILLAGRFRGKRVILLKHLPQGVLLVTGPFKVNGVPLRRVNARYVIATSTSVDLSGIDESVLNKASEDGYFTKDKASKKTGEEAFFKQGEKPEVG